MAKEDKILEYVKKYLGLAEVMDVSDTAYDGDITVYIDACLSDLYQVGVGTPYPNRVFENSSLTWDDFFGIGNDKDPSSAIAYVCIKTKLAFDPHLPATIAAMQEAYKEQLYRARLEFDVL